MGRIEYSRMMMRFFRYGVLLLVSCLMTVVVKGDVAEIPLYTILEPKLSCDQAVQLSVQTIDRLGFTLKTTMPTEKSGQMLIASRTRDGHDEGLTVTISCEQDRVGVEAVPDPSPCEQANRRATMAMTHLGFTITSASPAMRGKRGIIKGSRKGVQGQETTMVTILCGSEAIFMDTTADSPLLKSPEFLHPISDVRRGFFAYFKPMADALTQRK
jgi:hypothetical protein